MRKNNETLKLNENKKNTIERNTTILVLNVISEWICFCKIPTSARSLNLSDNLNFPILFKFVNTVLLKTFSFKSASTFAINLLSYEKINICKKDLKV